MALLVSSLLLSQTGPAPTPTLSRRDLSHYVMGTPAPHTGEPPSPPSDSGSGVASSLAAVTKLKVLTKPSRPMAFIADDGSSEASGYTIQLLKDSLAPALGISDVVVQMLANNNEIMSSAGLLQSECSSSDTLCIGGAAISITQSREENYDFLSSYFTNNVRLMTPVAADPAEVLSLIVSAVWQLVLGLVIFSALFCLVLTYACARSHLFSACAPV